MTDVERSEARKLEPAMGAEIAQSFYLMALLVATLSAFLGLGLLAVRFLA